MIAQEQAGPWSLPQRRPSRSRAEVDRVQQVRQRGRQTRANEHVAVNAREHGLKRIDLAADRDSLPKCRVVPLR